MDDDVIPVDPAVFYITAPDRPDTFRVCDRSAKIRHKSEVAVRLFHSDGTPATGYLLGIVTTKRPHPLRRFRVRWVGSDSSIWVGLLEPEQCEVVCVTGKMVMRDI